MQTSIFKVDYPDGKRIEEGFILSMVSQLKLSRIGPEITIGDLFKEVGMYRLGMYLRFGDISTLKE